jgi:hypothetical protein
MFPITPTDLRDRDLVLRQTVCGFHFAAEKKDTRPLLVHPEVKKQSLSDHPKPATDYHLKTGQREQRPGH